MALRSFLTVMTLVLAYMYVFLFAYTLLAVLLEPPVITIMINSSTVEEAGKVVSTEVHMTSLEINRLMKKKLPPWPSYRLPKFCSPKRLMYENKSAKNLTALVHMPGSDDVWIRTLLEEMTGFHTGSVEVKNPQFFAEGFKNNSVFAISTRTFCTDAL